MFRLICAGAVNPIKYNSASASVPKQSLKNFFHASKDNCRTQVITRNTRFWPTLAIAGPVGVGVSVGLQFYQKKFVVKCDANQHIPVYFVGDDPFAGGSQTLGVKDDEEGVSFDGWRFLKIFTLATCALVILRFPFQIASYLGALLSILKMLDWVVHQKWFQENVEYNFMNDNSVPEERKPNPAG